jgi:hypothetical protein
VGAHLKHLPAGSPLIQSTVSTPPADPVVAPEITWIAKDLEQLQDTQWHSAPPAGNIWPRMGFYRKFKFGSGIRALNPWEANF